MIGVALIVANTIVILAFFARDAHRRHLAARSVADDADSRFVTLTARLDAVEAREKVAEGELRKIERSVGVLGEGRKR